MIIFLKFTSKISLEINFFPFDFEITQANYTGSHSFNPLPVLILIT